MKQLQEKVYDLTKQKGLNSTLRLLKKYGWVISPLPWLIYKAFSPEITTKKQVDAAKKLIITGKNSGVKKMKIKVSHKAGLHLGGAVEGIPIKTNIGNSGDLEIEVEY